MRKPKSVKDRLVLLGAALLLALVGLVLVNELTPSRVWGEAWRSDSTSSPSQQVNPTPFLYTPYYGTEQVNCVYDHEYPVFDAEISYGPQNNPTRLYEITSTVLHNDLTRWQGPCTSARIGTPACYSGHNGIDYGMTYERVLAAANGQVVWAGWANTKHTGEGLLVRIDHLNGYQTRYGHLSAIAVSTNTIIADALSPRRRVIGISGNTGTSSGAHLHFEVEPGQHSVNPYGWEGADVDDPWKQAWPNYTNENLWAEFPAISNLDVYTSGASVTPPLLPSPNDPGVVVLDDSDTEFTEQPLGCWQGVVASQGYSGTLHYTTVLTGGAATCTGRWTLPNAGGTAGQYDLYVYVPNSHATTEGAVYRIHRPSQATQQAIVAQTFFPNSEHDNWVYLGQYDFDWNGTEYVEVGNVTLDLISGTLEIAADAVMFAPTFPITTTPPITPTTTITGCVPAIVLQENPHHGGDKALYNPLLARLAEEGYEEGVTLFFAGYDGSASIDDAAEEISNTIGYLSTKTSAQKFDLIAHGQGGLVARAYLRNHGTDNVARIVSVGTPYSGVGEYLLPGLHPLTDARLDLLPIWPNALVDAEGNDIIDIIGPDHFWLHQLYQAGNPLEADSLAIYGNGRSTVKTVRVDGALRTVVERWDGDGLVPSDAHMATVFDKVQATWIMPPSTMILLASGKKVDKLIPQSNRPTCRASDQLLCETYPDV